MPFQRSAAKIVGRLIKANIAHKAPNKLPAGLASFAICRAKIGTSDRPIPLAKHRVDRLNLSASERLAMTLAMRQYRRASGSCDPSGMLPNMGRHNSGTASCKRERPAALAERVTP